MADITSAGMADRYGGRRNGMMSRKDYILLAEALGKAQGTMDKAIASLSAESKVRAQAVMMTVLNYVVVALGRDNPRFDSERFVDAVFDAAEAARIKVKEEENG